MSTRRIFAAVEISEEARTRIAEHAWQLREAFSGLRVRWERPEKYHITLRFEAAADEKLLEKVVHQLRSTALASPKFVLTVSGGGAFENRRGPAVLWIGVQTGNDDGPLKRLAGKLADPGRKHGRFHPHITIARIKYADEARELIDRHCVMQFEPVSFPVNEIVLIESTLTPNGSFYNVLQREPLTGE